MQVLEIFDLVRSYFPDANVFASTFDAFTKELLAKKDELDLPVVTKEIGDTWIYGKQTNPYSLHCTKSQLPKTSVQIRQGSQWFKSPALPAFAIGGITMHFLKLISISVLHLMSTSTACWTH